MTARLYHYACRHSVERILAERGTLRPNPNAGVQKAMARLGFEGFAYPVIWVTDVDVRSREDAAKVGLAQLEGNITNCNRVGYRFLVPRVGLVAWAEWADAHATEYGPREWRQLLEASPGADPERWLVCPVPITGARLDEHYAGGGWKP